VFLFWSALPIMPLTKRATLEREKDMFEENASFERKTLFL